LTKNNIIGQMYFATIDWRSKIKLSSTTILLLVIFLSCTKVEDSATKMIWHSGLALKTGDLIFLDLDCGQICDAIEQVTKQQFRVDTYSFSHVGIIELDDKKIAWVWEAWPEIGGVGRSLLSEVVERVEPSKRERGGIWLLRWPQEKTELSCKAVAQARSWLDRPYDHVFEWGSQSFYCSELVALAFQQANRNIPVFKTLPMEFGSQDSSVRKVWQSYFEKLNMQVPQGQVGISPLGIFMANEKR
jgi:hypothetical protein